MSGSSPLRCAPQRKPDMTTIVLNLLTNAVTEYDWKFQSITPTHAGDASGLYELGGDTDAGEDINSRVSTGLTLWGASLKKLLGFVYLSMDGAGSAALTVVGAKASWRYEFPIRDTGESRCQVGRGIRENYLGLTLENISGADFSLDRIEVLESTSKTRRI